MKITVFTSNQPRHCSLIHRLSTLADEVYAIQECNTVFPGLVKDFHQKTPIMQDYFAKVIAAEERVFGSPGFSQSKASTPIHTLAIKMGDLSRLKLENLGPALDSDIFVVFGASFIKGDLIDFLVERGAYNIHMGISPFYRGAACNFWALHDGNPGFVGATVHLLTKGLDSGPMLFHALPKPQEVDPFVLGMRAVEIAHQGFCEYLKSGQLNQLNPQPQDKSLEIRYSKVAEFTDEVAQSYLDTAPSPQKVFELMSKRDNGSFLEPYIQ